MGDDLTQASAEHAPSALADAELCLCCERALQQERRLGAKLGKQGDREIGGLDGGARQAAAPRQ